MDLELTVTGWGRLLPDSQAARASAGSLSASPKGEERNQLYWVWV